MVKKNYIPAILKKLVLPIAVISVLFLFEKIDTVNLDKAELDNQSSITDPDTSRDAEGDTFSIVAYDKTTGQVGGAGCSCVSYSGGIDFLSDLITDGTTNPDNIVGAIHSQASYNATTQGWARDRMLAGDTPSQIINYIVTNDGGSASRQYGVVGVDVPGAAGWTGSSNGNYANDQQVDNALYTFSVQGNILDTANGQDLLDDMETIFNNTDGTLGDKLMAALQAAKRVGGDNRCQGRGNSGRTAFVQVLSPGESSPGLIYDVGDTTSAVADYIEPIDVLQCLYDAGENTPFCRRTVNSFPYTMDFETTTWEQETATCSVNSSWIRSRFASPSSGTGPSGASQGTLYSFVEASDLGGQGTAPRSAIIGSPCFEIPANHTAQMTFDYHMLGSNMGTLSVTASDNNGSSWTTLFSISGDQGSSWINDQVVDLSSYSGSTVKLRIDALTGNGFASDFAIDDIQITVQEILACTGVTKTWNGASWSPAGAPGATDIAIIDGDYDTDTHGNLTACSLTINSGRTVTINTGGFLDIDGDIVNDGSLIIEHQGSLVQTDPDALATNNGSIDIQLTTPPLKNRDFMILGSPMTTETRTGVFNGAYNVQAYTPSNFMPHPSVPAGGTHFADDNLDDWNPASGTITPGEGFLVYPQAAYNDPAYNGPPPVSTLQFNLNYTLGTLNNGTITRPIVFNGLGPNPNGTPNILANPYASPINASDFVTDNALVNEIYFWEHLTAPSAGTPGANTINVSMDDISMYNGTMGVPAANDPGTTTEPNGVISTGQGFGVKAFGAGNVSFTNSMRLTTGNTTLRTPEGLEKMLLKVENTLYGVRSYAGIGFRPDASAQLDTNFDSDRLATMISLYSHLEDGSEQLGIQTRESFDDEIKIPMGFSSQVESEANYVISIVTIEGSVLPGVSVFLIDHRENVITDLTTDNYEFTSGQGTFDGRFTLLFEQENLLGQSYVDLSSSISIYPNPAKDLLNIRSNGFTINSLNIFDMQGRRIYNHSENGDNAIVINMSSYQSGVYFVKVDTEIGSITKKIIKK
jgi:uncharacterized Ntn-hydrolase superfamily protein